MSAEPVPQYSRAIARHRTITLWAPLLFLGGLIFAVAWFGPTTVQTAHFGDDQEYLTMVTSFMRHGSPDFRVGDDIVTLHALPRKWQRTLFKKFDQSGSNRPPYAYFESTDHRFFGWHFFTYPACVVPLRAWMDGRADAFRAHQFTNLLVFCCALLSLLQLRSRPQLFWTLTPLVFLTPALWFLTFAHTESFVFSLGVLVLTCQLSGRPLLAILFSSLAATQYQPLAPVSLYLFCQWVWQRQRSGGGWGVLLREPSKTLMAAAFTTMIFVPGLFYFVHFGTANLIVREGLAGIRLISAAKFGWMFVDPNGGLLFYAPGVLLLLLAAAAWTSARGLRERSYWGLALLGCALFTMFASTCQRNWNHPTFGVSRYVLYGLAPLLLFIGYELARARLTMVRLALVVAAIALQLFAQLEHGFFAYRGLDAAHHTQAALYVLEHWPALYSPPTEIFCERTRGKCQTDVRTGELLPEYFPVVWRDSRGDARKVLAQDCDPEKVLRAPGWSLAEAAQVRAALRGCRAPGPLYINL